MYLPPGLSPFQLYLPTPFPTAALGIYFQKQVSIWRLLNPHKSLLNCLISRILPTQQFTRIPGKASVMGSEDPTAGTLSFRKATAGLFAPCNLQLHRIDPLASPLTCMGLGSSCMLMSGWGAGSSRAISRTSQGFCCPLPTHRNSGSCRSQRERTPQLSSRGASLGPRTGLAAAALQRASLLTTEELGSSNPRLQGFSKCPQGMEGNPDARNTGG